MEEPIAPQPQGSVPQQLPSFEQTNPMLAQWALDCKSLLDKIEHGLRGETEKINEDGKGTHWEKEYEQILNKQGIYELMSFLNSFVDKNTILSNFGENQVQRIAKINAHEVNNFLFLNHARFELKLERYEWVVNICTNFIEFTLYRAYNDNTKKWISPQTHENVITTRSDLGQPQGKKFLGLFG